MSHRAMAGAELRVYYSAERRRLVRKFSTLYTLRPCLVLARVGEEVIDLSVEDIFGLATALVASEANIPFAYPQPKELPNAQHS